MDEHQVDILSLVPFGDLLQVVDEEGVARDVYAAIMIISMISATRQGCRPCSEEFISKISSR